MWEYLSSVSIIGVSIFLHALSRAKARAAFGTWWRRGESGGGRENRNQPKNRLFKEGEKKEKSQGEKPERLQREDATAAQKRREEAGIRHSQQQQEEEEEEAKRRKRVP